MPSDDSTPDEADSAPASDEHASASDSSADDLSTQMNGAVRAVRREAKKAAIVPSVADGAVAALLTNVALRTIRISALPTELSLARVPGIDSAVSIHPAVPIALLVGVLVALGEYAFRMRRPPVEQFESVNPEVSEALRTARDTLDDDSDSRMVVALYEDVLSRLRSASSVELLPTRRVALTVVVVIALSAASIHVAIADIEVAGINGGDGQLADSDRDGSYRQSELENGSSILGDPEDVSAGSDELNATLGGTGQGDDSPSSSATAYDSTGYSSDADVESQRAGYLADDTLDDAALIRDYTLKIRDQDDE
ncbi:hypothetical protein KU306_10965 [Haloferax larsenii]|uniref:Uncharacterized protein n=1 Tax=Haloferax larsenii TaxID=302484 RepID=A0ABY5RAR6_HALLR|nr:hypothetical protein [Haloferax larsenii]UVE49441.1 hypothetical protein KU306_10965 [Haloferax larsenii]